MSIDAVSDFVRYGPVSGISVFVPPFVDGAPGGTEYRKQRTVNRVLFERPPGDTKPEAVVPVNREEPVTARAPHDRRVVAVERTAA